MPPSVKPEWSFLVTAELCRMCAAPSWRAFQPEGERMSFCDQMAAAIDGARTLTRLEHLSRSIWQGVTAGTVADDNAQASPNVCTPVGASCEARSSRWAFQIDALMSLRRGQGSAEGWFKSPSRGGWAWACDGRGTPSRRPPQPTECGSDRLKGMGDVARQGRAVAPPASRTADRV